VVPVDFSLTDSQQEIARLAGQLLDEGKADPWKELARSGLLALSLPADLGGDGLGVLDTAVLLAEIGRRAAPLPALATLMTGVLPVVRWGNGELRRALLPPAAAGELMLSAGIREPSDPMPRVPATTVAADGTVSGTKVGVPYCAQAGRVLLPVSFSDASPGGAIPPRPPLLMGELPTPPYPPGEGSSTPQIPVPAWRR
jgi:alkylation response protein AidB-like acyl-CoA dehydrogenase